MKQLKVKNIVIALGFVFLFLIIVAVTFAFLQWKSSRSDTVNTPTVNTTPNAVTNVVVNDVSIANETNTTNVTNATSNLTPSNTTNTSPVQPVPTPTNFSEISRGDASKNQIIFTFDAGSGSQSGKKILEALDKHNLVGTFFITGKFAEKNPQLVKDIITHGNEIFNHTYSHPDLTTVSDTTIRSELSKTEKIIHDLTGKSTKPYFRPPYGARNAHVLDVAKREGYRSIFWTLDALDWKESSGQTASATRDRILSNLKPGAIILMHIGDTITGSILDEVFTAIELRGYTIVPLSQGL